ncbi:hypothetical protein, partial [Staphylococcus capitis]|uniref:hypothetical protein n=1 Tax=Staphylococcus capitis TaxID=29388 RepID=UPI0016432EA0
HHAHNYPQPDHHTITPYDDALHHPQNLIKTNPTQQQIQQPIHQITHPKNHLNPIPTLLGPTPKPLPYINSLHKINRPQTT